MITSYGCRKLKSHLFRHNFFKSDHYVQSYVCFKVNIEKKENKSQISRQYIKTQILHKKETSNKKSEESKPYLKFNQIVNQSIEPQLGGTSVAVHCVGKIRTFSLLSIVTSLTELPPHYCWQTSTPSSCSDVPHRSKCCQRLRLLYGNY